MSVVTTIANRPFEDWRPIAKAPGYYISDFGNVIGPRGLRRRSRYANGYVVNAKIHGKQIAMTVNLEVARAFLDGPEQACVRPKDGNKFNSHYSNLEWCSVSKLRSISDEQFDALQKQLTEHPDERWAPLPSNDNYRVSTYGKVITPKGRTARIYADEPGGYWKFRPGNGYESVHRAVAKAFLTKDFNDTEVNHKDGNKRNNGIQNLEWCTRSENLLHRHRVLGVQGVRGEEAGNAILTTEQVIKIRAEYADGGVSFRTLAQRYGVATPTIGGIISRRKWKHV